MDVLLTELVVILVLMFGTRTMKLVVKAINKLFDWLESKI